MKKYDYTIVGAGLTGCVLANRLANIGKKVLILEQRKVIGGNCYDYYNKSGVLVPKYGAHCLYTNNKKVIDYFSKFTKFRNYALIVKTLIDGETYPIPINRNTLNKFFKTNLRNYNETLTFITLLRDRTIKVPKNSAEAIAKKAGWLIYDVFFKDYTKKQWKLDGKDLIPEVCTRIPIRYNTDNRKDDTKFTKIPKKGYTKMLENMLNHKNIEVITNTKIVISDIKGLDCKTIWTGPIDEYFNYKFGKLPYISNKIKQFTYNKPYILDSGILITSSSKVKSIRTTEVKHITGQKINKTTLLKEYPNLNKGNHCYPILTKDNLKLYNKYKKEAKKVKNVYFIGRLAEYKYINMCECVERALAFFEKIK